MSKKQIKLRRQIIIGAILALLAFILHDKPLYHLLFVFMAYITVGYSVIIKAFKNIKNGQIFDENLLMILATIGAFVIKEYDEALMVMWLYQVGEFFQAYAVGKSKDSITELMSIAPSYANLKTEDGIEEVDPDEVEVGSIIVVKAGEKIPLDGIIVKGKGEIDTSALTGESLPMSVKENDQVVSGSININGSLEVKVLKAYEDSTVIKILELVEEASERKAKTENFISRFAKYYTPAVTIAALILWLVPTLFFNQDSFEFLKRACSFLVISCPCALVISVPLTFFGGIGASSKKGILVKGSNYLEQLAKCDHIMMDKTGTITKGNFKLVKVSDKRALEYAAIAESHSNHPIARSILEAYDEKLNNEGYTYEEIAGKGIIATKDDNEIIAGNIDLLKEKGIDVDVKDIIGTVVYVAYNNEYIGYLVIEDEIKETSFKAIQSFKKRHIKLTILSGDQSSIANKVAKEVGIDEVYSKLLPQDKVSILNQKLNDKHVLAFVGDGINDAPVLKNADIGIAMGGLGSDAAIEASDIVIMDDNLDKINTAIDIAKKTVLIAKENIFFALGIKFLVLILGALGYADMWMAVFADVGVSFIAILNAMRLLINNKSL